MTFEPEERPALPSPTASSYSGTAALRASAPAAGGIPSWSAKPSAATRVENLAKFGQTTKMMLDEDLPLIPALRPDVVIVQAGMGDSLPHPGERVQRFLERFVPSTWHGVNGLERRAYFSGPVSGCPAVGGRRIQDDAQAGADPADRRIHASNPDEFRTSLDQLLTALEGISPVVVCIGLFDVDQHVFPKQHTLNVPFRTQRYRVLAEHPGSSRRRSTSTSTTGTTSWATTATGTPLAMPRWPARSSWPSGRNGRSWPYR